MDITVIQNLIGALGFPIVCCAACFWYVYHLQQQHKAESEQWTLAINNNTLVLQQLLDRLEREKND